MQYICFNLVNLRSRGLSVWSRIYAEKIPDFERVAPTSGFPFPWPTFVASHPNCVDLHFYWCSFVNQAIMPNARLLINCLLGARRPNATDSKTLVLSYYLRRRSCRNQRHCGATLKKYARVLVFAPQEFVDCARRHLGEC